MSPRAVSAHGALRSSQPASGAHLAVAPRDLRLVFNERVELAVARIELRASDSALVRLSTLRHGESPSVLIADVLGSLQAGSYTVAWQVAGRDGHPVRGTYKFVIAPGAAGVAAPLETDSASRVIGGSAASVTTSDSAGHLEGAHHDPTSLPTSEDRFDAGSPAYAAVRWLTYVALLGMIGAVAFRYVVLSLTGRGGGVGGQAAIPEASNRAARIGRWCAGLLLFAAVLRLAAQSLAMHGPADAVDAPLIGAMLTQTVWGWGWLMQTVAAVLALLGFALARRRESAGWTLAAAAALLGAVAPALSGHAAGAPRWPAAAVAADAMHIVAAAGWLGSLAVLLLAGLPAAARLDERLRGPAVSAMVNAFSPTALMFAGLAAITGGFAAWIHLGNIASLWQSSYGQILLIKLGVLSLVALTGAYNWLRVRPALGDDAGTSRLRRSGGFEMAIAVLVLAVTAVLVATSPPTPRESEPAAMAAP